ncbi:MAG: heavy-metal-associated domain-containing protein [Elusimicrobia bacterium]|nr:heavy-metal-associated domain-containing protein [Elusimicrobiota bacterium]
MTPRSAGFLLVLVLAGSAAGRAAAAEDPAAPPAAGEARRAPPPPDRRFTDLKSGIYDCEVRGMICSACAAVITQEVKRLSGVENAAVDFDRRILRVIVKPGRVVPVSQIKRALNRAAGRIDLGGRYLLGEIRYIP